ncbi:hypothetical protein POM88_054996 [Heracleum sosnowskyi]|uniref:Uncharacterized protein n=1 Tax=Heracleum sosnowskyi TaxID=360622 RepID=A0AAD8GLQ9_9APIA|nr:hypothetical protein POM88_054996 [Heracleum sosnowskyi]
MIAKEMSSKLNQFPVVTDGQHLSEDDLELLCEYGEAVDTIPNFFLREYGASNRNWAGSTHSINWENLISDDVRAEVPEIGWCGLGEHVALEALKGTTNRFLTTRLKNYSSDRNNPLKPKGLFGPSPYLHFRQIASQRRALEANKVRKVCPQAVDSFLEELIARRELADNFWLLLLPA